MPCLALTCISACVSALLSLVLSYPPFSASPFLFFFFGRDLLNYLD